MASVTLEVEIASKFPAEGVFKVFSNFENIAPKVVPEVFKSIETIQGNGEVGTTKLFTFGDAVPFTSGKIKVDAVDPSNYSYSYSFYEGDNLLGICDSITHHIKIVPSAEGGCVYKQTVVYNCKGEEKPSEEILKKEKELFESTYKAIEAYAAAHPEAWENPLVGWTSTGDPYANVGDSALSCDGEAFAERILSAREKPLQCIEDDFFSNYSTFKQS